MRKKYILFHVMLILLMTVSALLYREEKEIYLSICSSLYYVFLYTPIFLFLISEAVKETFYEPLLLRVGNKGRNALEYIKKIFLLSLLFSSVFSLTLLVVLGMMNQNNGHLTGVIVTVWGANVTGWFFIGSVYFFLFSFWNRLLVLVLTWGYCIVMAISHGVLFQIGKYIFDVFSVMIIEDFKILDKKRISQILMTVIASIFINIATIIVQKRSDVISSRRG